MEVTDVLNSSADDSIQICNCNGFSHSSPMKSRDALSFKIFRDPVHGQIELHPACVAIVDTPQFQRLRNIKQTGLLDYVFPGATHNRFGHSLGVCHLANKFVRDLRERQPELMISETDQLCVQIAALCHDLGHGPLSHAWENFMSAKSKIKGVDLAWKHEIVSTNMLDHLISQNNLQPMLWKYGIGPLEIELIKDFISGAPSVDDDKAFLYQIVNNDHSGLDVDKWDYFLRDSLYLGLPCSFEYERIIQCSKVMRVDGRMQICFRDKVVDSIYNIFRTRSKLHKLAYQHRVVTIIDKMFTDAFMIADDKITGPSGEILHMWDWSMSAAYDQGEGLTQALQKYIMLTDSLVVSCLRYSNVPGVQPAISLLRAIERRTTPMNGFYQLVVQKVLSRESNENELLDGISKFLSIANKEVNDVLVNGQHLENVPVTKDDICVSIVSIHWGKGEKNPVDFVHFYSKNFLIDIYSSKDLNLSTLLPQTFQEIHFHVLSRRDDNHAVEVIKLAFQKYWKCSAMKD